MTSPTKMIAARIPLRNATRGLSPTTCLFCQWRSFTTTYRRLDDKESKSAPAKPSVLDEAPRSYGKKVVEFKPRPLDRAIGLPNPPRPGENTGIDLRTWRERRDDFVNYDKHLAKRERLTAAISKPYYRDWSNMKFSKGKSFLAPPSLFKAERALYFPNMYGKTLVKKANRYADTTPVLMGKISVVSVFSSAWGENQAATFASAKHNPELHQILDNSEGRAQLVHINIEENYLKALLIRLFLPGLRKRLSESNWGKYFMVEKGLNDNIRDAIGLLNGKVGYTYLLDEYCKIRWAGSGNAERDERDGLVKGVRRLLAEANLARESITAAKTRPKSAQNLETAAISSA
ncbi:Mitochondrial ATPase complex subunit atp10 [Clarireedia jacksonii]